MIFVALYCVRIKTRFFIAFSCAQLKRKRKKHEGRKEGREQKTVKYKGTHTEGINLSHRVTKFKLNIVFESCHMVIGL